MNLYNGAKVCIAWDGFAKCRVAGGAYQASPIVYTATANASTLALEWQNDGTGGTSSGTVSNVRMRRGTRDLGTGFARTMDQAKDNLSRFFNRIAIDRQFNGAAGEVDRTYIGFGRMFSTPTAAVEGTPGFNVNVSSSSIVANSENGANLSLTATAAAATRYAAKITLDTGI